MCNEVRRGAFQLLQQVGEAEGRRQTYQKMNVIFNATDRKRLNLEPRTFDTDDTMNTTLDLIDEQWQAIPRRPCEVDKYRYARLVRHCQQPFTILVTMSSILP